jgi:DNA repair ATPase RecN
MSYDFEYYSGKMLRMPNRPVKPRLDRNPTAIEARAFADALEEYEREMKAYNENLSWYRSEAASLLTKFQDKLKEDYSLGSAEFDVIWSEAYDHSHSGGLQEVYYEFERLYEFAIKYTKVMMMKG